MPRLDWYIRANLKFRHLQLLVAIDDLRHMGRVAAHLNVTQPAISKTLAQLEQGLGFALFERTSRGMEPTEHGTCLIRHARKMLDCLVSARDELMDIGQGRITRVSIGVLPMTAVVLVPRFVAALEGEASDVAVNVREATMSALLPALRAGDIDLVVGLLPPRSLGPEFATERLYDDPMVVAVRRDHPLTTTAKLQWKDLAGYPMVLPPASALTRDALDHFMAEQGVSIPRRHVDSVSTLTNVGVLQFTDSVGFLSLQLARHYAAQGILQVLPLSIPSITISVGLVMMAERHVGAALRLIRRLLVDTAAQLPRIAADTAPLKPTPAVAGRRPQGVW
ncbi:MAG: LysR substrate-binding domain-containing protein [Lautropia sp.]